jgi:hypothetical protein
MGYADKVKSQGGGALEGVITDYEFMDHFPFGGDEDSDEKADSIYMVLSIQQDGADEPTARSLYLGSGTYLKITNKGKALESSDEDGSPRLYTGGEVFKFIASLEDAGFPCSARFPDPEEDKVIDFRAMIGARIRVTNEVDEEATKKYGKRKPKTGKHKGKEFNRTYMKVSKVLDLPGEGKGKVKAEPEAKEDTRGKKAKAEEEEETPAVSTKVADKALKAILGAAKDNTIKKGDLPLAVVRYAKTAGLDADVRDALKRLFADDEYFEGAAEREVIDAYKPGKNPTIALVE